MTKLTVTKMYVPSDSLEIQRWLVAKHNTPADLLTEDVLKSAWAWGAYREGMGTDDDPERMKFACLAIKRELIYNQIYDPKFNPDTSFFGPNVKKAVRKFQVLVGLKADGMVGPMTANALLRNRYVDLQDRFDIPNNWQRAQGHWESLDDFGAELINADGSADRGLVQVNSVHKPLTKEEAFDPETSLWFQGDYLRDQAVTLKNCADGAPWKWRLAVGSWRTPTGAKDWCAQGHVEPDREGTWAERAAYYVWRVDTIGRMGWIG